MKCSVDEALLILGKWYEEGAEVWVFAVATISDKSAFLMRSAGIMTQLDQTPPQVAISDGRQARTVIVIEGWDLSFIEPRSAIDGVDVTEGICFTRPEMQVCMFTSSCQSFADLYATP